MVRFQFCIASSFPQLLSECWNYFNQDKAFYFIIGRVSVAKIERSNTCLNWQKTNKKTKTKLSGDIKAILQIDFDARDWGKDESQGLCVCEYNKMKKGVRLERLRGQRLAWLAAQYGCSNHFHFYMLIYLWLLLKNMYKLPSGPWKLIPSGIWFVNTIHFSVFKKYISDEKH